MRKIINISIICFSFFFFTNCSRNVKIRFVSPQSKEVNKDNLIKTNNYVIENSCEIKKKILNFYKKIFLIFLVFIFIIFIFIMLLCKPSNNSNSQVKNKSSTMKKILINVIYAGGIILIIRIVLLLIKYLPTIIESYLKTIN